MNPTPSNYSRESQSLTFAQAIKSVFNKYSDFSSRARRSEYWYWQLFVILVYLVLCIPFIIAAATDTPALAIVSGVLILCFILAIIIPSLAVVARRLHDTGRSGWYYFMSFIPFVGGIILLIYTVEDSHTGVNQWGSNPKLTSDNQYNQDEFIDS